MIQAKGKNLHSGYTTGACAAAAAKAAVLALLYQEKVIQTEIALPGGGRASFDIKSCILDNNQAYCSVIKDAGDDPDVTDGAEIGATVIRKDEPGVKIIGGQGVGIVTKPGLEIPVGMSAINPVPRQMIERSVTEVIQNCHEIRGLDVVVAVNGGEELAKRTLNPRLGIIGGISIIGTTGIVIPYSMDAYKATISQSIDIAVACGRTDIVLTTGRRSEKFAQNKIALPEECFIQMGDFIGYALERCAAKNIGSVTIWGMVGKISKIAAGHLYTNISDSQVDIGFLVGVAAACGLPQEKLDELKGAVTANHLRRMLPEPYERKFCDKLCRLAAEKCLEKAGSKLEVSCIMSDYNGKVLGKSHAS